MELIDVLVKKGILSGVNAEKVKQRIEESGNSEESVLTEMGVSPDEILTTKGEYLKIPTKKLGSAAIPFDILRYIPEESSVYYKALPLALNEGVLEVGLVEPDNLEARDAINFITARNNLPFKIFVISESD
jgi:hypothetical protein